jgi:hypothetical protein
MQKLQCNDNRVKIIIFYNYISNENFLCNEFYFRLIISKLYHIINYTSSL